MTNLTKKELLTIITHEAYTDLEKRLAREYLQFMKWLPMESAPLDGTEVLVIGTRHHMLVPNSQRHVAVYRQGWWSGKDALSHVTHWAPLIPHPE